ncbi:MAG: Hpt domain-containing protein [Planctomycetota bacterium]|nr:Hpt domain-containing protein [Planctomycetota bacterium]
MDQEHRSNPSERDDKPLHSTFEGDPDLQDLVIQFVDELDHRVEGIRRAFLEHDVVALRRIAHQLKGAAGGYGFDPIGDAASRLEHDLLGDESELSSLSERVEDLIASCRAAVRPGDIPGGC